MISTREMLTKLSPATLSALAEVYQSHLFGVAQMREIAERHKTSVHPLLLLSWGVLWMPNGDLIDVKDNGKTVVVWDYETAVLLLHLPNRLKYLLPNGRPISKRMLAVMADALEVCGEPQRA